MSNVILHTNILGPKYSFVNDIFKFPIKEEDIKLTEDLTFVDCTFEQPFILKKIISLYKISFTNCKFNSSLQIIESEFDSISLDKCEATGDTNSEFSIQNCTANILNLNSFKGYDFNLKFESSKIILEDCTLENVKFKDINSKYSHINSLVEITNNSIKKLEIENNITQSDFVFLDGLYEFIILEGEFKKSIAFEGNISVENVVFESCTFHKRIDIKEGKYDFFFFSRSYFLGLILINSYNLLKKTHNYLSFNQISLHSCTFDKDITITTKGLKHLYLSNNNFKQLISVNAYNVNNDREALVNINFSGTNQGNTFFENINADIFLSGINFGNINFKNFSSYILSINEFNNKGIISFNNIKSANILAIIDSIIGNTEFSGVDVNLFKEIVIANSNLLGINFSNYPFRIHSYSTNPNIGYGIKDKEKWNNNFKNVYNQLKKVASNRGDIDTAIKYQALEYKYLKREKGFSFDKILLLFNQYSNNFGQSWSRGILFTLLTGLVFFKFYTMANGITFINTPFWAQYIIYISSFPKLELDLQTSEPYWLSSLIVWLSRIFISYGIYQTISAFRKYGKS